MTTLPHIPNSLAFNRLSELSPSRFTSIVAGCAYSYMMQQALLSLGTPSRLMPPVSYKNVIGTIIHRVFELVNKGLLSPSRNSIKDFWKNEIKAHEQRIANEFPSLTNLSIADYNAMFDTIKVVENMRPALSSGTSSLSQLPHPNEHKVRIPGLLKGSIDRVDSLSDGTFRIVDYKTGKVFEEDGRIKEDYIAQLNLYAYLLEEQDNVRVSELVIIDRSGTAIPVPYYPGHKQEVLDNVKTVLDCFNDAIEQNRLDSLCNPSSDNCRFCPVAHLCSNRIETTENPYRIVEGRITTLWNDDQLEVTTSDGPITVAKLRALSLDAEEWDSLRGKDAIFVNLFQVIEQKLYNRTDNTVIYIKDII